jgi:predicted RecB family nuclease
MQKKITTEIVIAYSVCPRKAFLLFCSDEKGSAHEFSKILQLKKEASQKDYIEILKEQVPDIHPYNIDELKKGRAYLANATITIENLEADCGVLRKTKSGSSLGRFSYAPVSFTGTQSIEKEDKLALMFAGFLLERIQSKRPERGMIVTIDKKTYAIKLDKSSKIVAPFLSNYKNGHIPSLLNHLLLF